MTEEMGSADKRSFLFSQATNPVASLFVTVQHNVTVNGELLRLYQSQFLSALSAITIVYVCMYV